MVGHLFRRLPMLYRLVQIFGWGMRDAAYGIYLLPGGEHEASASEILRIYMQRVILNDCPIPTTLLTRCQNIPAVIFSTKRFATSSVVDKHMRLEPLDSPGMATFSPSGSRAAYEPSDLHAVKWR